MSTRPMAIATACRSQGAPRLWSRLRRLELSKSALAAKSSIAGAGSRLRWACPCNALGFLDPLQDCRGRVQEPRRCTLSRASKATARSSVSMGTVTASCGACRAGSSRAASSPAASAAARALTAADRQCAEARCVDASSRPMAVIGSIRPVDGRVPPAVRHRPQSFANSRLSPWITLTVRSKCSCSNATASSARPAIALSSNCWCSLFTARLANARAADRRR